MNSTVALCYCSNQKAGNSGEILSAGLWFRIGVACGKILNHGATHIFLVVFVLYVFLQATIPRPEKEVSKEIGEEEVSEESEEDHESGGTR